MPGGSRMQSGRLGSRENIPQLLMFLLLLAGKLRVAFVYTVVCDFLGYCS